MKSNILLIVEGAKDEKKILGSNTHGLLSLIGVDYNIVSFANPIYELYDAYLDGEFDDKESLISFLRINKGLKVDENILSKNAFSSIYLVFDFEVQDNKYSDEKIMSLLTLFNNETDIGKLYINYPMVESYYHLLKLPDNDYNSRVVSLDGLCGKVYKKEVNENTCIKKNCVTEKDICHIVMHNYNKAQIITKSKVNEVNHINILKVQLREKMRRNRIYVLSTFPLKLIDYNYKMVMDKLNLVLDENLLSIKEKEKVV